MQKIELLGLIGDLCRGKRIGPDAAFVCSQFDGEKPSWVVAEEDQRAVADVDRRPLAEEEGDVSTNSREGGDQDPLTVGGGPSNTLTSVNQGTPIRDSFLEEPTETRGHAQ